MKERIINIKVYYDMNVPVGSIITPKETARELVFTEMMDVFGQDEYLNGIDVEVIDEE